MLNIKDSSSQRIICYYRIPRCGFFDCTHCLTVGEDVEWIAKDYKKSLSMVQQWMDKIPNGK
jgi:hypothetical protein